MVDTLDALTARLQTYVVSPLNAFGMGGFVFDIQAETIANLSSEITDHYTEDNKSLQDHIAIRPKRITLKGYVGELTYNTQPENNGFLQKLTQKLTTINAFLPRLSAAATQLEESIASPSSISLPLSQVADIYGTVKNTLAAANSGSNQRNAYNYFQALQQQGILMAVQTPWEFLTNMAIETIVAIQPEDTQFITDFAVTFKQIRIAKTLTTAYTSANTGGSAPPGGVSLQGPAALQCSPVNPLGIVPGIATPYSGLPGAQSQITTPGSILSNPALKNIFNLPI